MALKNLFDMVKADRYTADGREALIKAQEAETEDKVYNIGDISQKTGLMKTANGWVKPPKGKQPGKTDKPNPNGVVAQQKQKLEAEKYEAARRDAQAPSKKTEVNFPGLRKDVQEAIKRSTPEEIKAYIKELRTPGSRMSRYFDNPDLLANVYEDELNKMTAGKPSRASKEEAIRKDLGLTEGGDISRFSDEQIEKMYAKTQQTPEQQKADFDKSKIGQAVNKGRQEFAAEKTRQKELASKTNAIGLPKESKPTAEKTDGFDYRSSMEKDPRSAASFKGAVSHSIPMNQTDRDELEGLSKFMSEEKATYQNALKNRAQALVDGHKGNGDWFPEKEKTIMKIAKAVGYDKELHKFIEEEYKGYDFGYSEDSAPRVLTGDTRIRVRKA